ncbi:MAG: PEP-CTERM sorting domain-containing protein [Planctomycetes bacterium]|nr:PEP-CTERM sorting domain-containing protein [Planctomycetota bacterium]
MMKKGVARLVSVCLCGALAMASTPMCAVAAEVVFDNTVNPTGYYKHLSDSFLEMGDDATLAGTARAVTRVTIGFYSVSSGSFAHLSLHLYDKSLVPLGDPITLANVAFGEDTFPKVSFEVPYYTAPDSLIWTLSYTGSTFASPPGPTVCNPPTVGSSEVTFMVDRGSGLHTEITSGAPANFCARIEAVPEPATLAILALGGAALMAWRKKN